MTEQKFVYVDVDYLKELEETAKKVDYYKGIIDGINMVADRKTEPQPCEWCKFYDGENCFSQEPCKVMLYFKDEPQTEREGE